MKLEPVRPQTYSATLTAQELSTLLAGARMALSIMEANPNSETERALEALRRVLSDFDSALARLHAEGD
jgi:hypothetical protein